MDDGVAVVEGRHEVTDMFFADVLDTKVFNNEGEFYEDPLVFPKSKDEFALGVTVFSKAFSEQFSGKESSLWRPVHTFSDINICTTIFGGLVAKVVDLDYFFWDFT